MLIVVLLQFDRQPSGGRRVRRGGSGRGGRRLGRWAALSVVVVVVVTAAAGRGRQRVRGHAARVTVPAVPVGHYAALGRLTGTLTGLPGALAAPTARSTAAASAAAVAAAGATAAHRYDRVRSLGDRIQVRGQSHYWVPEPWGSWNGRNGRFRYIILWTVFFSIGSYFFRKGCQTRRQYYRLFFKNVRVINYILNVMCWYGIFSVFSKCSLLS